jgi:hypothetical protein
MSGFAATFLKSPLCGGRWPQSNLALACSLSNGFALASEVLNYLRLYNARCQPPWSDQELEHKAKSAESAQHTKIRGHLVDGNGTFNPEDFRPSSFPAPVPKVVKPVFDAPTEIERFLNGFYCSEAELSDASPIHLSDDWTQDALLLVSNLYQQHERINVVTDFRLADLKNGLTKPVPSGYGITAIRDELISDWEFNGVPQSDAGGWMRLNPLDGHGIGDKNVTAFRYILLEFDSIPLHLQISLLSKLPLPIAAILTSGGRSVHAWCRADCADMADYKSTAERLLNTLEKFGLDPKNKNPSRLSRLVGVVRTLGAADDGRQRLLYLNPEPEMRAIL